MISQPVSISDAVWAQIVDSHRYNERVQAMRGYKKLAEKDGPTQKHYAGMYEYLKGIVEQTDLSFLDEKYVWNGGEA